MKMINHRIYFLFSFVFLLIMFSFVSFSNACFDSSVSDIPWFYKEYKLETKDLPDGLVVKYDDEFYTRRLLISNTSDSPIYFTDNGVHVNSPRNIVYEGSEVPFEFKPEHKLVNSKVYFWRHRRPLEWRLVDRGGDPYYNKQNVGYKEISEMLTRKSVIDYQMSDQISQGRTRPDDFLPGLVKLEIPAFYRGKELILNVIVEYSLNKDYKKPSEVEKINPCQ